MTNAPERPMRETADYQPADAKAAVRLLEFIDDLAAGIRAGRSMGLGDEAIANNVRARFMDRWLDEWCDAQVPAPVGQPLLNRLQREREMQRAIAAAEQRAQAAEAECELLRFKVREQDEIHAPDAAARPEGDV